MPILRKSTTVWYCLLF